MSTFECPKNRSNYQRHGDREPTVIFTGGLYPGYQPQQTTELGSNEVDTQEFTPSLEQRIEKLGEHFVAPAIRGDYEAAVKEAFKNPTSSQ